MKSLIRQPSMFVTLVMFLIAALVVAFTARYRFVASQYSAETESRSNAAIADSVRRGDEVAAALKLFKEKNGRYPSKLTDLVPLFIQQIQPPVAGSKRWEYVVFDDNAEFILMFGFGDQMYPYHAISSKNNFVWREDY